MKKEITEEEQHRLDLERLEKMRPMDDDFMREMFRNNIPLIQFVLRTITGKESLNIISNETQYDLEHLLGAKSICLDALATDSDNQKYNIEVQRADKGASPKRARYHSSAIDVEFLKKNEDFEKLPVTYVIFITENDVRKQNKPIYKFERRDVETNEAFGDDEYIIFVNGAYRNPSDNSDLAKLIHDFNCNKPEDMQLKLMAESTQYYKEKPKGVRHMCKIMEDMRKEVAKNAKIEIAINLLKDEEYPIDKIAKITGLSVKDVKRLDEQLRSVTV